MWVKENESDGSKSETREIDFQYLPCGPPGALVRISFNIIATLLNGEPVPVIDLIGNAPHTENSNYRSYDKGYLNEIACRFGTEVNRDDHNYEHPRKRDCHKTAQFY